MCFSEPVLEKERHVLRRFSSGFQALLYYSVMLFFGCNNFIYIIGTKENFPFLENIAVNYKVTDASQSLTLYFKRQSEDVCFCLFVSLIISL